MRAFARQAPLSRLRASGSRARNCRTPARLPQRAAGGIVTRRNLGLLTGSLCMTAAGQGEFPDEAMALMRSPAERVLDEPNWPEEFPFGPQDFKRFDESPDSFFYGQPRFVTHIDDGAIAALTDWYGKNLPRGQDVAVLDMCSSWISHLPGDFYAGRVAGLGMNSDELGRNRALTDWEVRDLNVDPRLPYEDGSMDAVVNAVSIDYLNKPLDIVKEVHRVLKPGGLAAFSFSNRCFPTKAVSIWTATSDVEHVWIVGSYFHYSVPGGFTAPKCDDITPRKNGLQALLSPGGDPMFVVYARKSEA